MENFKMWCIEKIKKYPSLKEDIKEIYGLAIAEIDSGESVEHEIDLAKDDIYELIEDLN